MNTIVVTTNEQAWREAKDAGLYSRSTIDKSLEEVGFIHATFPDQTLAMANRHFSSRDDVLLLLIDADKISAPLRYEAALSGRPGTFPHIYGTLNTDAVYASLKLVRDSNNQFVEPDELRLAAKNSSIPCDIVVLPEHNLAERAIAASSALQKFGTKFSLSKSGPFPHASLYMAQFKTADLEKIKELLGMVATNMQPISVTADRYNQDGGYIDANFVRSPEIDRLQTIVVKATNPLRSGLREADKARMESATGTVRENLERFGYRGVGELFRPHMTLTRFTGNELIDTHNLPTVETFGGQFTKLGFFEMGHNGTCKRKLAAFDFISADEKTRA